MESLEPLQLEANGESSRDFIFVEDVVRGLVACALKGKNGESYNLASGVETKILNLAELIIELTGSKSELILKPQRKWDNSGTRFGSTEKSKNEIDFEAQISLKKGLSQTVEWTKSNKKYIQQCIDKHNIFL